MKTIGRWNVKSIASKVMLGLAVTTMLSTINVSSSFADNDRYREGYHDNGRYEQRGRGYDKHYRHGHDRRVYRSYGYRERVYVPPRVIYEPPQPRGIGVFFPPIYINP
ncbi:MAG: hypothetical protein JZU50_14865 [Desulfobulbaceae bacterium]|nr:hypothetical protein [Desulfobulbaceae bacterium]